MFSLMNLELYISALMKKNVTALSMRVVGARQLRIKPLLIRWVFRYLCLVM